MGDDGDQLLGEHVEWIARKACGLDVALVHGAGDGGAGDEVGAVLGKENAFADGVDVVAGAADALHAAGNRGRSFDLDDEVDGAHVDAEFEGGGGAEGADLASLQLLFDDGALRGGERAVMGAGDGLAGEFVERAGEPLGDLAAVDKEDGGVALADDFKQAGMNGIPDGDAARHLRGRAGGNFFLLAEAGHVFDGNFDAELELLGRAGVDDGDGAVAQRRLASRTGSVDQGRFRRDRGRRTSDVSPAEVVEAGSDRIFGSRCPCPCRSLAVRRRRGSGLLLRAGAGWRRGRCAGWGVL